MIYDQSQKVAAAADMRRRLDIMAGGATTVFVFEVKFSTRDEWVNYLHNFRRNGGRQALLERLPFYIVDEHLLFAKAVDASGMYHIEKTYDGQRLQSAYDYYVKVTLVGSPIMSESGKGRVTESVFHSLNDILEGHPVSSINLIQVHH